jgi:hypothetical protein
LCLSASGSLRALIAALLGVALIPCAARADSQDPAYASLPAPPDEVYEALLNFTDDGAFERVSAGLKHLDALFRVLDGCCVKPLEAPLRDALGRRDAHGVRSLVLEMIAVDLRRHLEASGRAAAAEQHSQELQMAVTLYAILSPSVREMNPARDARIRGGLKRLLQSPSAADALQAQSAVLSELGATVQVCPSSVASR